MYKNKNKIRKSKLILVSLLVISFIFANFFIISTLEVKADDEVEEIEQDISELNEAIEDRRRDIDTLQKEIDAYAAEIKTKQKEARGLSNQIAILDNQITKVNLDMESTEAKIQQTKLEIKKTNLEIQNIEDKIKDNKEKIGEYLRLIYKNDQVSYLEVLLVNENFSDFFDQIKYTQNIHQDLKNSLTKLNINKNDLEVQKTNWEQKAELEQKLKDELQQQKSELTEKNTAQEILLVQARLTEKQYQNYQYQLQLEQQQINSELSSLEKSVREKMEERDVKERFEGFGPARLAWPVSPARGITAYFHDPDYPFRYIFEHPGVDVRAYQGTPIQAPESGYVARVKFAGNTSYAYVMIVHNDGLSTVFGHVSRVYVKEDQFVTKGETVALTGGMPGTTGAGNLSTGPHLHFEVRLNGIPVNPLEYLPAI